MVRTAQDWYTRRPWIDEPDADIDAYCRRVARPEDYDLKAKLEHWQEHGVVIFEGAIDPSLIDLLNADLDALVRAPSEHELTVEVAGRQMPIQECPVETLSNLSRVKFCNVQTASLAACHLSLNRSVMSFLGHVFGSPACLLQSLLFHKGSQQPIHLDYPYVQTQKHLSRMAASWIPLEDVHEDAGPLAYYCGSQRPEIMPFFDWGGGSITMTRDSERGPMDFSNHLAAEMKRLEIPAKVFLPKRGDVLIWHAYLAHEGLPIRDESRTRRSYVTHYAPLDSYPEAHMKPNAIRDGHCVSLNGGYVFEFPWYKGGFTLPSRDVLTARADAASREAESAPVIDAPMVETPQGKRPWLSRLMRPGG